MKEFALLQHVFAWNDRLPERVLVPPGDDLALVRLRGRDLLAGVDQVVDGVHVDLETAGPAMTGRKAVARSLSDVAAMAGRPLAALATVALPRGFGEGRALELFEGMRACAAEHDSPLIGGDVAVHRRGEDPLVCTVTVLAEPPPTGAVGRGGAVAGDGLYVTGELGGSGEGRHLSFEPRIRQGLALAARLGPRLHAMIDISDGLGRDAGHIADASGARVEIDAERVPRRAGIDWRRAVSEGEDYELCFAAAGEVPAEIEGVPITRIGRVGGDGEPGAFVIESGRAHVAAELGWQHGD